MDTAKIQRALAAHGFDPGAIDGIMGPKTERAIVRFKRAHGLRARPYLGPLTLSLLFGEGERAATPDVPWMNEVAKYMGLNERAHFQRLFAWLRSDGKSVGDPRQLPWCGDLVETAIKLTLRHEPFTGRVALNPYLARNWLDFGEDTAPAYGAVAVFWRGSPHGSSGHVGFAIGVDHDRGRIRVRGGNQSNSVSDTWLDESRLLGLRWPKSWSGTKPEMPAMNSAGAVISRNEG